MLVTKRNGNKELLDINNIRVQTTCATKGLDNVSWEELELKAQVFFYDGIKTEDIQKSLINTAVNLVTVDKPNYTYVAGRLTVYDLIHRVSKEYGATGSWDIYHRITLEDYIEKNKELFSNWYTKYSKEDINYLNSIINPERDEIYTYQATQVLLNHYLIKNKGSYTELIQHMHMAIAMCIFQDEQDNRLKLVEDLYNKTSTLKYVHATPINSGCRLKDAGLISCMVNSMPDNIEGIFDVYKELGIGSKRGSGFGTDVSRLRSLGADIRNVKEASSGKIPFVKIINDIGVGVNQMSKRPGAIAVYTSVWDIDIFDFIDLKKHHGEDRVRARDIFPAITIDNVFMERLKNRENYTLFCPKDTIGEDGLGLPDVYGKEFRERYLKLEEEFKNNPTKFNPNTKVINTIEIAKAIISSQVETGMPFIYFKDTANEAQLHKQDGIIRSSNLCVTGDTKILTRDYGYTPIGELVESGIIDIECWNGKEWSLTRLSKTGVDKQIWKVTLGMSGLNNILETTNMHKWYVLNEKAYKNGRIAYNKIPTYKLEPGMRLARFNLPKANKDGIQLPNAYDNGFFSTEHRRFYKETDELYNSYKNNLEYAFTPNLDKLEVPAYDICLKDKLAWLAGLVDGNGSIVVDNNINTIELPYVNKEFLRNIILMLQEIGIYSSITTKRYTEEHYRVNNIMEIALGVPVLVIDGDNVNKLIELGYKPKFKIPKYNINLSKKENTFITVNTVENTYFRTDVYCGKEPKRGMLMFNGVLTSNCTEILIPTDYNKTAICNLGSLNLAKIPVEELEDTVSIAIHALDNIIDLATYPNANIEDYQRNKMRSIGLGAMGEAEYIATSKIEYGSKEHREYVERTYSKIREVAFNKSRELGKKRGTYNSEYRNHQLLAIAPNSTSGLLAGTTNGIEPVFNLFWLEENKHGSIPVTAPNVTEDNKIYYKNAYQIPTKTQIEINAIRTKYIDQSISFNLYYVPEETTDKDILDDIIYAWELGLKTIYYVRSEPPKIAKSDIIKCIGCEN